MGCGGGKPENKQQTQPHAQPGGDQGGTIKLQDNTSFGQPTAQQPAPKPVQLVEPPKMNPHDNFYAKFKLILSDEVTSYLQAKHQGYENLFDQYESQLNIQKNEIEISIGLLSNVFEFKDHFFDHIKDLHTKIRELFDKELGFMRQHQEKWTDGDVTLLQKTIIFLIQMRHVVVTIQNKVSAYWEGQYFKSLFGYLQIHQAQHEPFWHNDLKDCLLVEKHLKHRLSARVNEIREAERRAEEEFIKRSKAQLKDIHDEVIKKAHEDHMVHERTSVNKLNHKYATPKVMES